MSDKSLDDYQVLNVLEFGSLGTCFKVCDKITGELFLWKSIDYGNLTETKKQILLDELQLLNDQHHPNSIQYLDYIIHLASKTVYVVMEWCQGGNLTALISECKKNGNFINEDFIWKVLYQVGLALESCHYKSKESLSLHKSVKLSNIFLDASGNVKLGDCRLSQILQLNASHSEFYVESSFFNSPDIKSGKELHLSVIWSLGCLIYELASLHPPFSGSGASKPSFDTKDEGLPRIPSVYSEDLQNMVRFLFENFENHKLSIKTILQHPTVVKKIKTCQWNSKEFSKIFQEKCKIDSSKHKNIVSCMEKQLVSLKTLKPADKIIYSENMCEKTFQEKWVNRIELIRKKEAELKMKEEKLEERERQVTRKEKEIVILEKAAREKVKRAEIYLKQCKQFRVKPKVKNCNPQRSVPNYKFDTSFSADPGDTSILPTVAKMVPEKIASLPNFKELKVDKKERQVSFNEPFPRRFSSNDIKLGADNKENHPQLKNVFKDLINIQVSRNDPKKKIKTSTFSIKSNQHFKSDVTRKSFLSKSYPLKLIGKKPASD